MDADYGDDLVLLTNILVQAKSLLHSLEQAAIGIGLCVNSDNGAISTLNDEPLKLVD